MADDLGYLSIGEKAANAVVAYLLGDRPRNLPELRIVASGTDTELSYPCVTVEAIDAPEDESMPGRGNYQVALAVVFWSQIDDMKEADHKVLAGWLEATLWADNRRAVKRASNRPAPPKADKRKQKNFHLYSLLIQGAPETRRDERKRGTGIACTAVCIGQDVLEV
jgi:hypothetical protein